MGKKKDKGSKARYTPFDYMSGGRVRKLGDRYGVDASEYNINYGRSNGGGKTYKGDREDYDKAVADAAMRDYDTRRTMEAQAMSGKKKAKKYAEGGFNNITDVVKANNMRERWHKKAGGGGSFSSASDFAGQTMRAVERDRKKQTAGYDQKYATKDELNELKDMKAKSVDEQVEEAQYEPSEKIKQAKERVAGYKEGVTTGGDGDEQRTEAANSYNKYKLNLSTMK